MKKLNKSKTILITIILLTTLIISVGSFYTVSYLKNKNNKPNNPPNNPNIPPVQEEIISKIGIGGGGAFFNPMIDPTNENIIYTTSDMGALYYSYNKGETWSRTKARGVFTQTHISSNGTVFAGGYGLYASYDKGKTINLIYPQDVKKTISRCGWNENLMLADGYDNGYIKCIISNAENVFFATIDWTGNFRLIQTDYYGKNLKLLHTEKLNISNPVSDIDMYMEICESGFYITFGTKISYYDFLTNSLKDVYYTTGYIKDICKIKENIYFLDQKENETAIFYTKDFISFNNLLDYNNLTTTFTKYGRTGTFNWHFKEIDGNNFNNIFLSFSSKVNEFDDTVDGIMKFNGTNFEWIFDSMFKTRHNPDLNLKGWSYGSHGPFYGIYASPHNDNLCLVSNIETIYLMEYENEENKKIQTLHCNDYNNGKFSTNGIDCQTTYFVKEDPFNKEHIIICTTDMGLQNSFDGGKTWQRMEITGQDYDIYNTCYDLYFDKYTSGKIYAVWSSRHDAPYNPTIYDKDYTKGAFAISNDGGITWDFSYSTGIPSDSIPVKMSINQTPTSSIISVATFNRGFYLSTDGGLTFTSLNNSIETIEGLIFGEDIVMTENKIYMLTAPFNDGINWHASSLYEYDINTKTNTKLNLGNITLARSLTYHSEKGLFINVIPTYQYEWFEEYNDGIFVNEYGGIYHYENGEFKLYFENQDGIFHSAFSSDGKLYATDTYGKVFIIDENEGKLFLDGLFTMLKNVSFSNDYKILYITTFGGGTYKIIL